MVDCFSSLFAQPVLGRIPLSGERCAEPNLDHLTDAEIYAAMRYLDPQIGAGNDDGAASAICMAVVLMAVAWLGFIWLFPS